MKISLSSNLLTSIGAVLIATGPACTGDASTETLTTFTVSVDNVSPVYDFQASGVFNTPVGATDPAPIGPGEAYEATFAAAPGSKLSFATMFVMSNDLFYAPDVSGIALFREDGEPVSGDVTSQILLWDAGTEINQEPGAGADQAPLQAGANTGDADTRNSVRLAMDEFTNLPAVSEVIQVTLTPAPGNRFTLRITNVSTATSLHSSNGDSPVLMAPGAWVVHAIDAPLFVDGSEDAGEGLEALAEDGDPSTLAASLAARTGLTSPIAPGAYAVHGDVDAIFNVGSPDRGDGLEALAEDGDPTMLADTLAMSAEISESGTFAIPAGSSAAAPAFSGERYEFMITAMPGDRLSLATMLVQSNDLFYAFAARGIALFDDDGMPISGDHSAALSLWDAGTEKNEIPGAGPNQAPRQAGADTGDEESMDIDTVMSPELYPAVTDMVRVTITPAPM